MSTPPRPRLLVLASTYPRWANDHEPGFVHELAKRLVDRFDVTVLCPHAQGAATRELLDGVTVVRYRYAPAPLEHLVHDGGMVTRLRRQPWMFALLPGFLLGQLLALTRLVRKERPVVIHAHWIIPQAFAAALARALGLHRSPILVTSHGADLYALTGWLPRKLKQWTLRRCTRATVVSTAMLEPLRSLGMPADRTSVAPMGADTYHFSPDPQNQRNGHELLFVGRLVEKKGVAHLLRAMPEILRQRPDVRLTIAGFGPDEARLHTLAEELGLLAHVAFLGARPQSELPALYRRAAVFIAPFIRAGSGDQEGLPVALMEAIACGCPVLAGDVAGLRDLLGEHAKDVVFDPCDEAGLARKILRVLANRELAARQASQLGAAVRERFDWERVASGYYRHLLETIEQG